MKIICTKTKEVNTKTSCRKEYCCERLKGAFEDIVSGDGHNYYTNFTISEESKKVSMTTHHDWNGDSSSDEEVVDYCPFCGTRLIVENISIDNTEDEIANDKDIEICFDEQKPDKKDNLWTWFKEWFRFKQ